MNQARMKKRNRRKKAALAVALVALLAMAGTFAWANYTQRAVNEAVSSAQQGGRLHDDFTFETAATSNKDVYVENFQKKEEGGVPIYARVRFLEYMEKGPNAGKNNSAATSVATEGELGETSTGNGPTLLNRDSWTLHHFEPVDGTDEDYKFREYWDWTYGSSADGSTVYMPTFNKNKDSYEADVNGSYQDTDASGNPDPYFNYHVYSIGDKVTENASYDADDDTTDEAGGNYMSNNGFKKDGRTRLSGTGGSDGSNYRIQSEEHLAANTLQTQKVISMADWKDPAGSYKGKPGNYWVYDDDGWAYWADPIDPGTATGLLLTNIAPKAIGDDWYYGIEVQAQFASYMDWAEVPATGGATDPTYVFTTSSSGTMVDGNSMSKDAYDLLEVAKENDTSVKDAPSNDFELKLTSTPAADPGTGIVAVNAGGEVQLTASATREGASRTVENAAVDYSWSVTPASGVGSFEGATNASTAKLKIDSGAYDGEATVTVSATTNDDEDSSKALTKTSSVKVKVNPQPPTPPAAETVKNAAIGSEVKLDVDGDGTLEAGEEFYVLAKQAGNKIRLSGTDFDASGTYGLVMAKSLKKMTDQFGASDSNWKNSNAKTWCDKYYSDTLQDGGVKSLIPEVTIKTNAPGQGNADSTRSTNSRVFFLSSADVFGKYIDSSGNQKNATSADLYTTGDVTSGGIAAFTSNTSLRVATGEINWWWLRSPTYNANYVADVNTAGDLYNNYSYYTGGGARPCFWVYLGSS